MKKDGKAFVKLLIFLGIIVAIVFIGFTYFFKTGKTVDTKYTSADLDSYTKKTGVVFDDKRATFMDYLTGNYNAIGSKPVTCSLTNSELTAMVNKTSANGMKNISIKVLDDKTIEASFNIGDNIEALYKIVPEARQYDNYIKLAAGAPVYSKAEFTYLGNKKFSAVAKELRVGQIDIPIDTVNKQTVPVVNFVNDTFAKMDGFTIKSISLDKNGLNFDGTIPSAVEKVNK